MAGIIHRGSDAHKAHLKGLEIEKSLVEVVGKKPDPTPKSELKKDGPTVSEFVNAGYDPKNYPPAGYASRSTPKEITAAIANYKPKTDDKK